MSADAATAAVRRAYTREAARYDGRWKAYVSATVTATLRRLALREGERVLDVGCGTGVLLSRVQHAVPTAYGVGVDLVPDMLDVARDRLGPAAPLVTADVSRLPFASGLFDVVVSTSAFHYWPEPFTGLRECARMLRPGGRLVLSDWCHDFIACKALDFMLRVVDPAHRRTYGTRECGVLLAQAGFTVHALERYRISAFWGMMTATATAS